MLRDTHRDRTTNQVIPTGEGYGQTVGQEHSGHSLYQIKPRQSDRGQASFDVVYRHNRINFSCRSDMVRI